MQTLLKNDYHKRLMWVIPVALFAAMIIDSALPAIFPTAFLGNDQIIVSHLAVYFLVFFCFYFNRKSLLWMSFLFGLLADSYYSTVLGLYATVYFLLVLGMTRSERFFPKNLLIQFMLFIVAIFFVDFLVYSFYLEIGQTTVEMTEFLSNRLGPTLIYNTVLYFALYYPMRKLRHWLGYEDYVII